MFICQLVSFACFFILVPFSLVFPRYDFFRPSVLLSICRMSGALEIGVRVCVVRADNLKKVDTLTHADPYVKLYVNGNFLGKTKIKKNKKSPEWNETHVEVSGVVFRKPEGKYYEFLHHIAEQLFHNNEDYVTGETVGILMRLEEDVIGGQFFLSEKYKGKPYKRPLALFNGLETLILGLFILNSLYFSSS